MPDATKIKHVREPAGRDPPYAARHPEQIDDLIFRRRQGNECFCSLSMTMTGPNFRAEQKKRPAEVQAVSMLLVSCLSPMSFRHHHRDRRTQDQRTQARPL
ncbi:MAG: hypothetical protein ACREPE_04325 [Lysobacter sp.]